MYPAIKLALSASASLAIVLTSAAAPAADRVLNANVDLQEKAAKAAAPAGFTLKGDVVYGEFPDRQSEKVGRVIRLLSARDKNGDGARSGSISETVRGISAKPGRWFRFRIRALAQDGFSVERDALFLKVEFFRDGGTNSLDHLQKTIYPQIAQEREALRDQSTNSSLGSAAWRSYDLEFRTPFPEVDTLRLSVRFDHGAGRGERSEFCLAEFELTQIPDPAEFVARMKARSEKTPSDKSPTSSPAAVSSSLVHLAGRWYYDSRGGERTPPREFDHTNADRLYYKTDRFEAPFADNMSAWLKKGDLDRGGHLVKKDKRIADNVRLTFTETSLVVRSHNLPNHPTAVFPDRWRALDGNPNYIQEQNQTWYIPLEPRENPDHVAMEESNANRALPGGPIGVAVNGVIFFNPFDADSVEAIWRLDRCCGHPSPGFEYHYHKYPVCVKSPWTDDGKGHSPLIGFAFDGFPIFGPYEAEGELAKDAHKNPLNAFNIHYDEARGWHYHVTPGRFPHLIGGYLGFADSRNRTRPPRPRGGPQGMGGPGRRGPGGPGGTPPGRPFPPDFGSRQD
jgi:YHYH protein